ncbi:MAG: HEAT repeat domain-containing protein [Blastocatellia bacterium]
MSSTATYIQRSRRQSAILAMICALLWLSAARPPVSATAAQRQPSGRPASSSVALAYRFVAGERAVYRLHYASASAADFSVLFGDQQPTGAPSQAALATTFKSVVDGELSAAVLSRQGNSYVIVYRLRHATVSFAANGQPSADQAEAIKRDLERDLFAQVNRQGKVLTVWLDPAAADLSQNFARALIALAQFVLPDSASAQPQWETQEDDPNGQYVARYRGGTEGALVLKSFRKAKLRYLKPEVKPKPDEMDEPTTITPKGELLVQFDSRRRRLVSLSGTESQTVVIAEKQVARASTAIQMSWLRSERLSASELARLQVARDARAQTVAAVRLSATRSEEATENALQRGALGQNNLAELLNDLDRLSARAGDPVKEEAKEQAAEIAQQETALYLKFKALVYIEPEQSAAMGRALATADPQSAKMRVLAGALGIVAHAAAQAALVSAMRARPNDWLAQSLLIPTLGAVGEPTPLAEEALRELAFNSPKPDIAATAQLALGAVARNLAGKSPERAAKIVEEVIKRIDASASEEATRQMLFVLGNAGVPQALPALTRFAASPSPALRAAAVMALRFIAGDQTNGLLIHALADPEETVKVEAAAALGFREMNAGLFKAQKQAFERDQSVNVRQALLNNLWKAHETFPEARQLVKQAATGDRSEDIRKAAADIMAMYPKDYFN